MTFKTLDIFFYKGYSLTSRLVRLLTSIRYGIPFKDAYSHVAVGYDDNSTISAEASGTKLVSNDEIETTSKSDVIIYRFLGEMFCKEEEFWDFVPELMGRGYAYARYAIDAASIFSFVTFILLLFFGWFGYKWLFLSLAVFFQIIKMVLKRFDKKTSDCAELTAIILDKLKLMPYFSSQTRNEFPNSQLTKMKMLSWYGLAEVVGIWDYKTKSWKKDIHEQSKKRNFPFYK